MSEFEFPEAERVDFADIEDISLRNQSFLESKYFGDVAHFRAEVIQRMIGHNALHGRIGWLYFREKAETRSQVYLLMIGVRRR